MMRAMRAEKISGYDELKLVELPKPAVTDGRVLVRITATGVTPLDHTILIGDLPIFPVLRSKARKILELIISRTAGGSVSVGTTHAVLIGIEAYQQQGISSVRFV